MHSVSIIGCGWFGLPLAKTLLSLGFAVKGTKTSSNTAQQLTQLGIQGFALSLPCSETIPTALLDSDILIINLPPGLRKEKSQYLLQLQQLVDAAVQRHYKHVIYVSSSGIYSEQGDNLNESSPIGSSLKSQTLWKAEQLVSTQLSADTTTIFRFAGLVGPNRHPGRFLANKKEVAGGNLAVNLVHLNDIISATVHVIEHKSSAGTYNICCDLHESRETFYTAAAHALHVTPPTFSKEHKPQRKINGQQITTKLGYSYQHNTRAQLLENSE